MWVVIIGILIGLGLLHLLFRVLRFTREYGSFIGVVLCCLAIGADFALLSIGLEVLLRM